MAMGNVFTIEGSDLGDIICTDGDYKIGEALVLQMVQFFESLRRPARYESAAQAIYAAYEKARGSWLGRLTPFSTVSCQMKEVGRQAQGLMAMMCSELNVACPPGILTKDPPKGIYEWLLSKLESPWTWILLGLAAAGTVGGLILLRRYSTKPQFLVLPSAGQPAPAPSRALRGFGGPLDDEEFRRINARRQDLIDKKYTTGLLDDERVELERLTSFVGGRSSIWYARVAKKAAMRKRREKK